MFESVSAFVAANAMIVSVLTFIALMMAIFSQQRMRFWLRDFWVTLPLIGTIARQSKITAKGSNGWMAAEEKLCSIYKPYISLMPESKFNERIEYMRNSGDLGRTPMTVKLKALLFMLVIAEGLGFSYILGTWMAREGSANTHTMLMFAIVFVIGVILVWVTHAAGHQYYRTSLLRSCFQRYKEKAGKEYASSPVALANNQSTDINEPDYTRCINRVAKNSHDKGSYSWSWVAGITIAVIFVLSSVMRWSNLEGELSRESAQQTQAAGSNPFAEALPAEVIAPQQEADKKAQTDIAASTATEGLAAILMLGFIFVVTQIVGFGAGYKYGFAGKETYKDAEGANSLWFWSQKDGAYADTGGFSTYDSYWQTFQPLVDLVNGRLKDLQQRLKQYSHENLILDKTFSNYLEEQQAKDNRTRKEIDRTDVPLLVPVSQEPPASFDTSMTLDQAKAKIAALTDKQAQIDYFSKLAANIQDELRPWLKQRKEEEKARQQAVLNDLF